VVKRKLHIVSYINDQGRRCWVLESEDGGLAFGLTPSSALQNWLSALERLGRRKDS
jgi:hypothetical protein